jgi:hypothetical protein
MSLQQEFIYCCSCKECALRTGTSCNDGFDVKQAADPMNTCKITKIGQHGKESRRSHDAEIKACRNHTGTLLVQSFCCTTYQCYTQDSGGFISTATRQETTNTHLERCITKCYTQYATVWQQKCSLRTARLELATSGYIPAFPVIPDHIEL